MRIKKVFTILIICTIIASLSSIAFAAAFSDVPEDHPYKAAIDFCQSKGIVNGMTETTFMPDAKLTRGQLATIWARSLNIRDDNHTFKDITGMKKYYDNSVIVLRSLGTLLGVSDTKFSPDSFFTREQLAVLTMRTYNLGVANKDAYTQYTDQASISKWAQDGVSACINAAVFEGLFDKESFMPQEPVTRAEICKLIYNISMPFYNVTIGTLEGGTIIASPTEARPGTVITLTITPDTGKQMKAGTLKFNDTGITGTTFIMPAEDVTITAEFEDKPVLESIAVTSPPTLTTYTVGEALDLGGLVITATYSDESSKVVTEYTTTPVAGSTLDTVETVSVTVSYTEGEITKTASFDVEVSEASAS